MNAPITVIIPVYNSEATIEECINSVLHQSIMPQQIIVVDDGSTDNSLDKINKFDNSSLIKIFSQKNQGVSCARNLGLRHVNTKYVTFIDSDDQVKKDYLLSLLKGYEDHSVDLVISGISQIKISGDKKLITNSTYPTGVFASNKVLDMLFYNDGQKGYLWNKLWRVDIIRKYNLKLPKDISMAEDLLFTVNYLKHTKKVYINNDLNYMYMIRGESLSSQINLANFDFRFLKTNLDFIEVCQRIIANLSNYDRDGILIRDATAFLGRTTSNFLRQLRLYNKDGNIDIQRKMKNICIECQNSILRSKTMSMKNKAGYYLTIYFPKLMLFLDKKRFSNK